MNKKTQLVLIVVLVALLLIGATLAIVAFAMLSGDKPQAPTGETEDVNAVAIDPNAIAIVATGSSTVYPTSVEELLDAVDESGNTVITLLKDVACNKAITLPYSCTIDFAGFTIATNLEQGLGLQVRKAGTENQTITLKNGKLENFSDGLRVQEGAVVISNMQMHSIYGFCVALYDANQSFKDINRIENSTLYSEGSACLSFNAMDTDFGSTGIAIENSTLICSKEEGAEVFVMSGGETKPGVIHIGDHVQLYSYSSTACDNDFPFTGEMVLKEKNVTVEAAGNTWQGMTCWTTESDAPVLDILMIGNSFCYSYVDELYGMAESLGYQLNITNLYRGGCSIKNHWTWLDNPIEGAGKCEYYITGALGRYKHPTITTLAEALEFAKWDVITCQQHFDGERTVDFAAGYESCSPYAANMFSYLKQNYPDADLYWHETWAYGVGYQHPDNKDEDPENDLANGDVLDVATQTRQYNTIREVSTALCRESDVGMIPVGDAWQLARAQLGDTLNRSDFCHDGDAGGGQYLNACVWLEVLLKENCVGNTWRPADYILFEDKIAVLQQAAHDAVAAME